MALRFRKSTKIGPVRLNFSNKGMGWSVGAAGVRYGKRADGRRYASSSAFGVTQTRMLDRAPRRPAQHQAEVDPVASQVADAFVAIKRQADSAKWALGGMLLFGATAMTGIASGDAPVLSLISLVVSALVFRSNRQARDAWPHLEKTIQTVSDEAAADHLQRAHLAMPGSSAILFALAYALEGAGRDDEAEEAMNAAVEAERKGQ